MPPPRHFAIGRKGEGKGEEGKGDGLVPLQKSWIRPCADRTNAVPVVVWLFRRYHFDESEESSDETETATQCKPRSHGHQAKTSRSFKTFDRPQSLIAPPAPIVPPFDLLRRPSVNSTPRHDQPSAATECRTIETSTTLNHLQPTAGADRQQLEQSDDSSSWLVSRTFCCKRIFDFDFIQAQS